MNGRHHFIALSVLCAFLGVPLATAEKPAAAPTFSEDPTFETPADLLRYGQNQKEPIKVTEAIHLAVGFGNTFIVKTNAGDVVIDTSSRFHAPRHRKLLQAVKSGPIRTIILTHGHADHTGGISLWKEPGTQIVAHRNHVEFMHYQERLAGFFAGRNAAQFALPPAPVGQWAGNYGARIEPTILFDDRYEFELGGTKFEVYHTPGETPDHATVWMPDIKAAFVGDNYYSAFPNLYTLRGTQPRSALDYVQSLNKVLALKPEILLPSHGMPIRGNGEIVRRLTRYRDAIQYVHDEVVKGMNAGKDVHALMREIKLPSALALSESYGRVSWSVRGIYEGYVGWFDLNPAMMYDVPTTAIYTDLTRLAGGPDAVAKLAMQRVQSEQPVEALHLADVALAADGSHTAALEARLKALQSLQSRCRNSNERGWLDHSVNETLKKLKRK